MTELSILIPARCEMFLKNTIEDVLEHIEADTEIIAVLDGQWAEPPIKDHERVTLVYHPESIGQRAATNDAARIAKGKYLMKLDAHCAVDQGFDRILLEDMQPNWCMVPVMRNLHVFDWVCPDGHRRYQGHSGPCEKCGKETERELIWVGKTNPASTSYCFTPEPKFKYFGQFKKRPEYKGNITETMSLQGSCFMVTKEKYFELNLCDETWGSWGSQGIEVACKVWLSGGRVVTNHRTWYAHAFRTKGGDWGFPYPLSGSQVAHAKQMARDVFFNDAWDKQVHPLSWLVEKFWPVPGWSEEDLAAIKGEAVVTISENDTTTTKGILYYTDNRLDPTIMTACQKQLEKAGLPIVSVSLQPIDFGQNIVIDGKRGPLTLFRQILAGLEALDTDIVFFAEHDVLYDPSHFDFTPERDDLFYYNNNMWKVRMDTGEALFHYSNHTSQLCAQWALLLEHYRKRVAMVEENGFNRRMGFEPGTHGRAERVDDYQCETWMSEIPNIDLRHKHNLTQTRWSKKEFRNQRFTKGWTIADEVPGWGVTKGKVNELLAKLVAL